MSQVTFGEVLLENQIQDTEQEMTHAEMVSQLCINIANILYHSMNQEGLDPVEQQLFHGAINKVIELDLLAQKALNFKFPEEVLSEASKSSVDGQNKHN